MDGFKFIVAVATLLVSSSISRQTPVELTDSALSAEQVATEAALSTVSVAMDTSSSTTTTVNSNTPLHTSGTFGKQCSTARGIIGACAARQDCQFSTAAVDLTLFATHGYVKPCSMEEVCCPLDAFVSVASSQPIQDDTTFNFDEDD